MREEKEVKIDWGAAKKVMKIREDRNQGMSGVKRGKGGKKGASEGVRSLVKVTSSWNNLFW